MTVNGWIQILLYCAVIAALVKPLGAYLTRVLDGTLPWHGLGRAPALPPRRRRSPRGSELARLCAGAARLQPCGRPLPLRAPAAAGRAAPQPGRHGRGAAGARVQHRRLLRHQHQLAELRRRDDDEPSHPDGRAHRPELRLRRDRHRRRGRRHPRLRSGLGAKHRQLLGRPDQDHPLRAAAHLRRFSRSS